MSNITVSVMIPATPETVWADISDISTHTEWMEDAVSIELRSGEKYGVGTTFDCCTSISGIQLTDKMEVTSWHPPYRMGVRHVRVVTGVGEFTLTPVGPKTLFQWSEELNYPWWLGGPIIATVSQPVLRRVWRRNLRNLASRFDSSRKEH